MKLLRNRRLIALVCAGLGAVGLISLGSLGGTTALFSSRASTESNSINSSTITLTADQSRSTQLHISQLSPGDEYCDPSSVGPTLCPGTPTGPGARYVLDYSGSGPAFVGMNFSITSTAAKPCTGLGTSQPTPANVAADCKGAGESPLFAGYSAGGAADLVVDVSNSAAGTLALADSSLESAAQCSADTNRVVTCSATVSNIELSSAGPSTALNGEQWSAASADELDVSVSLPSSAGNRFQGSTATFTLTGHAVQWNDNVGSLKPGNPNSGHCDPTTFLPSVHDTAAGSWCPVSWS